MTTTTTQQPSSYRHGIVTGPAIKKCACCQRPKIDLRKRASFGIGCDGHLLCPRCWQREMRSLEEAA